ncbi:hypothetical protein C8R45DRAFT_1057249 [Mycena sanguinolenta]|nr:hypothetical protein C8R45DRAFT_1057249 [Mycena sanguinolenta]
MFLFRKVQMSAKNIDFLLEQWALSLMKHDNLGPFENYEHLYKTIDATKLGDAPWQCFQTEPLADGDDAPSWARQLYEIWYRDPEVVISNMLDNPDFHGAFDTKPYVHLDSNGKRCWHDFMSANFAWNRTAMIFIYEDDPTTEGSMYTPLFFGSDKPTVSVATGNLEYHPSYLSIGNIHNSMRRGHRNGVVPFVFLAIPKSERKYDKDPEFRKFKRQLYHASLAAVLSTLKPGMTIPVVRRCPDGHFQKAIYDLGPVIADYPEQVMLAGIVQNWAMSTDLDGDNSDVGGRRTHILTDALVAEWPPGVLWDEFGIDMDIIPFPRDFPRADNHEILSPDLLHQIIKGSFKDHLVTWVGEYLYLAHSTAEADSIMDEIDRRIAAAPVFPCLRRFKQGRRFNQWTGDDSKALMKVYLPAIKGLVPPEIVQVLSAFLDFCYLVRRSDFDEDTLAAVDSAVKRYHAHREIFRTLGVRPDGFSLPRQHSMTHYHPNIENFGAPNELYFVERGMIPPSFVPVPDSDKDDQDAEETRIDQTAGPDED